MKQPKLLLFFVILFSYSKNYAQNVGIGTNTPVNKLSVNGKVNITDSLGIGTTTPAARLDVVGSVKITDGTQGAGKVFKSNANGLASWGNITGENILTTPPVYQVCPTVVGTIATGANPFSIVLSGNYAYVVSITDGTMQIFNISNPATPTLVSTVITGTDPKSIAVSGDYAYVVNQSASNLVVYNISNPATPLLIGSVATGISPVAITVSGNYAYVLNFGSSNMQIFNISNPSIPTVAGTVAIGNSPTSIAVSGNYAYVTNNSSNTMQVINFSNPATPFVAGTISTGNDPTSVTVAGNYVYVVNRNSNNIQVINVSNPTSPTIVSTTTTGTVPNSVFVSGSNAYVVNVNSNSMQIFNINSPTAPFLVNTVATGNSPWSVAVAGNSAYVLNISSSNLQVFNNLPCSLNYTVAINPATAQTIAMPLQWNPLGNDISNNNTGNVGIGTSTPLGKLHIAKTGDAEFYLESIGSKKWSVQSSNTAPGVNTTFQIIDRNLNVSRLGIDNNGFVGINTTAPANELTVNGNIGVSGKIGIGTLAPTTTLDVNGGIKTKYSGTAVVIVAPATTTPYQIVIPALPAGWDYTNTVVLLSAADGAQGYIKQVKLTSTSSIDIYFEALGSGGPVRFNWIIFKM